MAHVDLSQRLFRLLYIEDNPADVFLVRAAIQNCALNIRVDAVDNGESAIDFLQRRKTFRSAERPQLVLLDLNLPRKGGEEVLIEIKTDAVLKGIPVVVFTSAASEVVCRPIYQEYANTCIRKPIELDEFLQTVRHTCEYWFKIACLPQV